MHTGSLSLSYTRHSWVIPRNQITGQDTSNRNSVHFFSWRYCRVFSQSPCNHILQRLATTPRTTFSSPFAVRGDTIHLWSAVAHIRRELNVQPFPGKTNEQSGGTQKHPLCLVKFISQFPLFQHSSFNICERIDFAAMKINQNWPFAIWQKWLNFQYSREKRYFSANRRWFLLVFLLTQPSINAASNKTIFSQIW